MKIGYYFCLLFFLFFSCDGTQTAQNNIAAGRKGTDSSLKWIDYRQGELPPEGYYSALDSTIKRWGIRYERIEGGCEIIPGEKQRYEQHNEKYFEQLEKQLGSGWRQRFDQEVRLLDSLISSAPISPDDSTRINKEVKRTNTLQQWVRDRIYKQTTSLNPLPRILTILIAGSLSKNLRSLLIKTSMLRLLK
ncbi:hypothetical protein D3C79_273290 [compost metagenome]